MKNLIYAIEIGTARGSIILASEEKYDEEATKALTSFIDHAEYVRKDAVLGWIIKHADEYIDCYADICQLLRDLEEFMEE